MIDTYLKDIDEADLIAIFEAARLGLSFVSVRTDMDISDDEAERLDAILYDLLKEE